MATTELGLIEMRLLATATPEDFEAFLRDDFLPRIGKDHGRVGSVLQFIVGVERDRGGDITPRYLLLITWSGLPGVLGLLQRAGDDMMHKLAEQCVITERKQLSVAVEL